MNTNEQFADTGNMVMLPIDELHPHPDNPRKELGDLTELADSIRANGVFQNLTVVKEKGGYTVIIGHRRCAASKIAGLTHLPCVIVEMTPMEQLQTMLLENMQRSDLTAYEQAQGFQMMIDMGDTVDGIVEKTGFSKTTVRKRLEIAKLDSKTLKKVSSRQLTLADFDELAKIDDIEVRNKLLGSMGTANFKNELQSALKDQKTAKRMEEWLAVIRTFATEDPGANYQTRQYIGNYGYWNLSKDVVVHEDASTVKYFYKISKNRIDIYKEKDVDKEAAEKAEHEEKQRKAELRRQRYEDINVRHFNLRRDFVKTLSNAAYKRNAYAVYGFVANTMYIIADTYSRNKVDLKKLAYLLGVKIDEKEMEDSGALTDCVGIRTALEAFPEKTLFCMAYCVADDARKGYWKRIWNCGQYEYSYEENADLTDLYDLLEDLGYEMSDEEKKMQSGSYELFKAPMKVEKNENDC